jgi:hypothetical protein
MEFTTNASKLHRKVGEILNTTLPFKAGRLYQEVAVSELFPSYSNNKDRYDWVLPDLFTVIECHGKQHYQPISFGNKAEQAVMNFQAQQFRDNQKEEIALLHGWTYVIIPYTDEKLLTSEYLIDAYTKAFNPNTLIKKEVAAKPDWLIAKKKEANQKAKEYRKQQYQRMKELKHGYYKSSTNSSNSSEEEA